MHTSDAHLLCLCVWTTHASFHSAETYCYNGDIPRAACRTMKHYQAAGFSKEVSKLTAAPRRPSTNRMYDDRWLRFTNWATWKGFDPLGPTAAQIAAFLYEVLILMACPLKLSKDTGPVQP